ncbi:MAG: copper ion binding protein, partial [Bacilli bacterium]
MKKEYIVEGMTCSACAAAVENGVSKVDGVKTSNVNIATNKLTIEYDENLVTDEIVKETVEKVGYGLKSDLVKENYQVIGMTCSACAAAIEKGVSAMPGVESAMVNFATNTITVSYDDNKVKYQDMKKVVKDLSYDI